MNKGIVLGIVILVIGMSFTGTSFSLSMNRSQTLGFDGNILYVGGNGSGNYTTIQDAIDNASDGDTVFVYDDSSPYYENIFISRSINLIGENRNTTIIDGQNKSDTVRINAHYVNISGFTIQHCGHSLGESGIVIFGNYCTIKDNIITLNEDNGILLYHSNNNTISGNIITNNHGDWYHGVWLLSSDNNIFVDNNISENGYGFSIHYSDNNTIKNNIINDNYNEDGNFGCGIWAEFCNYNLISHNNISNNHGRGIDIYSGSFNNISWNTLIENGRPGDGICLRVNSHHNVILGNVIRKSGNAGIVMFSSTGNNNYNTIVWNDIEDSYGYYGICIQYTLVKNKYNKIYHNNIINNLPENAIDVSETNSWDNGYSSGGNFWSDYTGEDYNGDGIGDEPYPIPGGVNKDRYPLMEQYNTPPYIPNNPDPYDSENDVPIDTDLSWEGGDIHPGDTVTYDVYFGTSSPPPQVQWNQTDTIFDPGIMEYETTYYWQIVAKDNHDAITKGPIWHFTTKENSAPSAPTITGPNSGEPKTSYEFTFNAVDPDGDDVRYIIDWGDSTSDITEYVASGTDVTVSHTWAKSGTFTIKAQAMDIHGAESEWAEFTVTMPRDKAINNVLLLRILERFPVLERFLTTFLCY